MYSVLEIGVGGHPAILRPGGIFTDEETQYTGVDARPETPEVLHKLYPIQLEPFLGKLLVADSAELPFGDETFSHVVMRSVFGEYTMPPPACGSELENTRAGVYEAFRVLQPGGQLLIAEENTPEPPASVQQVCSVVAHAGFEDIRAYPCQMMTNPHWGEQRKKIWVDAPLDSEYGYLVSGIKPSVETEEFEMGVFTSKYDGEDRDVSSHKTVALQRAKGPHIPNPSDSITVVSRDATFPLSSYRDMRRTEQVEPLFL